jgi:hypothetical protein
VTREELARRLREASDRALAVARELIVNQVPDERRFDVVIKPHHSGHDGPLVDPLLQDLWHRSRHGVIRELTEDQVVTELCIQDRVPEWIDISLEAIELPRDDQWRVVSFIQLRCSRTLVDDPWLWYANEGVPPFHILGPAMPHDWVERHMNAERKFDPQGARFLLPSRKSR